MTPKEKAQELFSKYNRKGLHQISNVINRIIRKEMIKQCALIAVDEILSSHYKVLSGVNTSVYEYWQEVKRELQML